jgi:hypothetical protein
MPKDEWFRSQYQDQRSWTARSSVKIRKAKKRTNLPRSSRRRERPFLRDVSAHLLQAPRDDLPGAFA